MKKFIVCACLTTLTACAQPASKVTANYVSPSVYEGQSCETLTHERNKIVAKVNQLTKQQDAAATTDAVLTGVSLLLFWPAAFALMIDDDKGDQLASMKGNYDAITEQMQRKGCKSS